MADTTNDPLGIESMIKGWADSMNTMSEMIFKSPFQPLFDESAFKSMLQQPFFKSSSNKDAKSNFIWPFQQGEASEETAGKRKDIMTAIKNTMKNWQTMAGAMSSPESMSALFKGVSTIPEMLINITQSTIFSMAEINQKMAESASRMGQSVQAYKFNNIDENIFKAWSEIYEKEFRKFLRIPKLGLTREYQEKLNDMTDKLNICQTNMAEFLRMLSIPFQRSAIVMQDEIDKLAEKGQLSEDPQFYYQMWLKILEGHFMTLFQTSEYVETLTKTVYSMSQFTSAKESVAEDMLKHLPIASRSEMDDMAKELHLLKRDIRNIKKKISLSGGKI
ncbi:MAG: hypothetical protein HQK70_02105 [Desulfamplus sp.]|nr:hypothetical protein [Desulfamplus sp.]